MVHTIMEKPRRTDEIVMFPGAMKTSSSIVEFPFAQDMLKLPRF
jgi:hypothetical protein